MTGRRLYDHYCDARKATENWPADDPASLPAWSFLSTRRKKHWNDLARRITPKPKKRAS